MAAYFFAIGQRVLRVDDRNPWEAAVRAAIRFARGTRFVSGTREGSEFFLGRAEMTVVRPGVAEALFSGNISTWRERLAGYDLARWDKIEQATKNGDA